jgi:hypothetical protein
VGSLDKLQGSGSLDAGAGNPAGSGSSADAVLAREYALMAKADTGVPYGLVRADASAFRTDPLDGADWTPAINRALDVADAVHVRRGATIGTMLDMSARNRKVLYGDEPMGALGGTPPHLTAVAGMTHMIKTGLSTVLRGLQLNGGDFPTTAIVELLGDWNRIEFCNFGQPASTATTFIVNNATGQHDILMLHVAGPAAAGAGSRAALVGGTDVNWIGGRIKTGQTVLKTAGSQHMFAGIHCTGNSSTTKLVDWTAVSTKVVGWYLDGGAGDQVTVTGGGSCQFIGVKSINPDSLTDLVGSVFNIASVGIEIGPFQVQPPGSPGARYQYFVKQTSARYGLKLGPGYMVGVQALSDFGAEIVGAIDGDSDNPNRGGYAQTLLSTHGSGVQNGINGAGAVNFNHGLWSTPTDYAIIPRNAAAVAFDRAVTTKSATQLGFTPAGVLAGANFDWWARM